MKTQIGATALEQVLRDAKAQNRAALIGYIPAGFPVAEGNEHYLRLCLRGEFDGRNGHPEFHLELSARVGHANPRGN